jgi:A/G-specific adenine glycosylase
MKLTQTLLKWYKENARGFPWRIADVDPYVVLISETMLQQTQTSRVAARLPLFLKTFPTINELAKASNGTMLRQWQGMGYNSRALRLRDTARAIVEQHGGIIPSDVEALQRLPGVGSYTSAAIACFAYNKRVVVLDVNVRRVYSRLISRQPTTIDVESDAVLVAFAEQVIPARKSAQWHHAVMDLGATICTARAPKCDACPLSTLCPSAFVLKPANKKKLQEPMFRDQPQRIWRGRIVEALRDVEQGKTITITALCKKVLGSHTADESAWFDSILTSLAKSGHVTWSGRQIRLAD